MRHLYVVVDMSKSMKESDLLRPSKLASAAKVSLFWNWNSKIVTVMFFSLYHYLIEVKLNKSKQWKSLSSLVIESPCNWLFDICR